MVCVPAVPKCGRWTLLRQRRKSADLKILCDDLLLASNNKYEKSVIIITIITVNYNLLKKKKEMEIIEKTFTKSTCSNMCYPRAWLCTRTTVWMFVVCTAKRSIYRLTHSMGHLSTTSHKFERPNRYCQVDIMFTITYYDFNYLSMTIEIT